MSIKKFIAILISIFLIGCSGQNSGNSSLNISSFSKTLTGNGASTTYAVTQDDSGNVYFGGSFNNNLANDNSFNDLNGEPLLGLASVASNDGFLVKFNNVGEQQWIKTIGGEGADVVQAVTTDGNNIYVVGKFEDNSARDNSSINFLGTNLTGLSTGAVSGDIFVAKLNSSGVQQWIKTLGGTNSNDTPNSIIITNSGDILVGGIYYNNLANTNSVIDFSGASLNGRSSTASQDGFIAKLSSADGTQTWIKTIGGTGSDRVYRLAVDSDDSIYVPGQYVNNAADTRAVLDFSNSALTGVTATNSQDGYLAKLASNGTQTWIKTIGGEGSQDFMDAVVVDSNDDVFVTGSFENDTSDTLNAIDFLGTQLLGASGTASRDTFVSKISNAGTQSWIRAMGGTGSDRTHNIGKDSSGNLYLAGYITNNSANTNSAKDYAGNNLLGKSTAGSGVDGFLVKLSNTGVQRWIKLLGGDGNDVIEAMSVDSSGNASVVGYLNNNTSNDNTVTDFADEALAGGTTAIINNGFFVRYLGPE